MHLLAQMADQRLVELTRETAQLALARTQAPHDTPRISLASLIADLADGNIYGENREALQDFAERAGVAFDPHRPHIPFEALRDLTKGTASAGGYLVATDTRPAVDILRPWSVTARAGVIVETGLQASQAVPKVTAKATPYWLPTEASGVTPSQPTLAQISMEPKTASAMVAFSRQLSRQTNAEWFVRRELMRTVGTAVDQAVINGSGASGQPTGILLTAGVQTVAGATFNAQALNMKRKVADMNVADDAISFLSTPAVRELLESRERAAGGGRFVWDGDKVADRPARVTTDMPAATMLCGDFSNVYVGIWGEAFQLLIDPSTNFRSGGIQAQIQLSCDVAVLHGAGFCSAGSIS